MILNTSENIEKAQKQVEKLNGKIVSHLLHSTAHRHVKEENEPMMDNFIDSFQNKYAVEVVGKTMKELVKFIKDV
jgi:hypothetical protein